METFAERGYHNASLAEIADRAGLTQAGVLHYFRSKERLLTGVLELRDQVDIETLGPERPHGLAFVHHLVDTARRNAERPGIVRLYAVLSAESVTEGHPAQAYFRERYEGCAPSSSRPCTRPGAGRGPREAGRRDHRVRRHRRHGRPPGAVAAGAGAVDMAVATRHVIDALLAAPAEAD
ncbi:helix-turn-helix domain-containing protein [Streptomyces sp. M19]